MAIVVYQTASPTIGTTEYSFAAASASLPTKTDLGVYSLDVDFNAALDGDLFLIQLYEMGVASGTKRVLEVWNIEGPPGKPVMLLPSTGGYILGNGWDWTVKKVSGTDRALPFTVWRIS